MSIKGVSLKGLLNAAKVFFSLILGGIFVVNYFIDNYIDAAWFQEVDNSFGLVIFCLVFILVFFGNKFYYKFLLRGAELGISLETQLGKTVEKEIQLDFKPSKVVYEYQLNSEMLGIDECIEDDKMRAKIVNYLKKKDPSFNISTGVDLQVKEDNKKRVFDALLKLGEEEFYDLPIHD